MTDAAAPHIETDILPMLAGFIDGLPINAQAVADAAAWLGSNMTPLALAGDSYPALIEAFPHLNLREQLCALATFDAAATATVTRPRTSRSGVPLVKMPARKHLVGAGLRRVE